MTLPRSALRPLFVVTILTGSFLLFLVQPMIARMALPRLGGAPAVWNSAMLVYQALLLIGYGWAHWLGRFSLRRQGMAHLALFLVAAVMLPIGLGSAQPGANANPVLWVPWLLITSIGPLFLAVSAQAPLMQSWFARAGAGNPYALYAASNLGSFAGLIAYPLLVEPQLPIRAQSYLWTGGYILLALLVAACALAIRGSADNLADQYAAETPAETPAPSRRDWFYWVLLAAVPSGLMLSTTLHLTTDIVAMPLLWVVPLGLYLISFSVAFADGRGLANLFIRLTPIILILGGSTTFVDTTDMPYFYGALGLLLLFSVSVALHATMYANRPEPAHLTRFYLAMSVGGVIGGLFCALLAPMIFNWGYEHPVLVVLAAFLVPQKSLLPVFEKLSHYPRALRWLPVLALLLSLAGNRLVGDGLPVWAVGVCLVLSFVVALILIGHRKAFAVALLCLMLFEGGWHRLQLSLQPGTMTRSYFGIYTVQDSGSSVRNLVHGTTVHGMQNRGSPERELMHTSYYAPRSGVGLAMDAAPRLFGAKARIGVVGLGTGTLACYARPGQSWRFYEIDPAMVEIAKDPSRFTFLARCQPHADVRVGDARLVLGAEREAPLDLLVIDAFSSDAVPMHLLTREAFATYRSRLTSSGLLMVHISNRYLDLEPVLAAAGAKGWHGLARRYKATDEERQLNYANSLWIALSPDAKTLNALVAAHPAEVWSPIAARRGFKAWTDDHASILPVIKSFRGQ